MNLAMLLEMAAESFPERGAVTCGAQSLTYAALLTAARTAASVFRERGAAHAVLLDVSSPAVPIALFGAAAAGIPYVPLNYRLTTAELDELLLRAAPGVLISTPQAVRGLTLPPDLQVIDRDAFLDFTLRGAGLAAELPEDGQAVAVQLFTSGTTGRPKAAVLRHENLMSYILGTLEFGVAAEDEAALVTVPPYHIAGISAVLSSTYAGRRIVQMPEFDPARWLELCRDERVTHAFLVPTMLSRIVAHLDRSPPHGCAALRALAYGGGKMPLPVIERAMHWFPGVDFTNAYGLTETSSTICLLDPADHRAAAGSERAEIRERLASVGRPIGTIEIDIRDAAGHSLPAGQAGDVFVRGAQVAGEYRGVGSLLDADGWFPTRDRGRLDAEGYLFLEGRADDVIVRGGENISPGEIEDVLLAHPAVADAAVVAAPSLEWGEAVAAAVVLHDGARASEQELQDWVRARLRSSRVPERIAFRAQLPYNELGKVLRRQIRQDFAATP